MIFINDLPNVTHSIAKMVADKKKVFRSMISEEDRELLQRDIDQRTH